MTDEPIFTREFIRAAGKAQKKADATKHICLFPECKENAISSHSQQRGRQLKAISKSGDVYSIERNLYKRMKRKSGRGFSHFKKTPISKASVFPGFCSRHDATLFASIEKKELVVGNKLQAALFFLRANSFEYIQKKQAYIWNKYFLGQVGGRLHPEAIENYHLKMRGMLQYLEKDAPYYFEKIFDSVKEKDGSTLKTAWVEISKNIMISTSCCFSPLLHMHIEYMISNQDCIQPSVSFSVVPNRDTTHVIVSWLEEHDDIAGWFKDALTDKIELELLINQFSFGETEDTCISPELWENLNDCERSLVSRAAGYTRIIEKPAPLPRIIKL